MQKCPYVTDESFEKLKNEIVQRTIAEIKRDVIPEFRQALAKDIKDNIYKEFFESLGKETFSVGKKIFIRFLVLLGFTVLALTTYLGTK